MYDRRNICAARTRIGNRALRERRPPPRGTRGTVRAVACPRIFSFVSLKRRAAWQPGPAPPVPLPAERRRGTEGGVGAFLLLRPERAERGQGEMSRTAGPERPPLREMNESGENRERWAGLRSGPDGATAPRAYARSQANGVSARRLREMNEGRRGRVSCGRLHAWGCDPSDRPTHLVMPGRARTGSGYPGISLRQASSRVGGPMDGRSPGKGERGA